MDNTKKQKKQTCHGCANIVVSETGISFCPLWNRIISPTVTDACRYKDYTEKGGQQ